jgi:hypothetical protein
MHILILSKRNSQAQTRLLRSAEDLARFFKLDPALVVGLKPSSKDPAVRAMQEREGAANLLEALAVQVGADISDESLAPTHPSVENVTAVTDAGVQPEAGMDERGDELPPPVIDEFPADKLPDAEPTEEEPAKESKKKTAGKSSKRK